MSDFEDNDISYMSTTPVFDVGNDSEPAVNLPAAQMTSNDTQAAQIEEEDAEVDEEIAPAELAITREWKRQFEVWSHPSTYSEGETFIHHFNYMGQWIHRKSWTPAAVSLFVIIRGAKAPYNHHQDFSSKYFARSVIMSNAMQWIDPVLYHGPVEYLDLEGEELREQVTGYCEKTYSQIGNWKHDLLDADEEVPRTDMMNVESTESAPLLLAGYSIDLPGYDRQSHASEAAEEDYLRGKAQAAMYHQLQEFRRDEGPWTPDVYYPSKSSESAIIPHKMRCHFPLPNAARYPTGLRHSFTPDDLIEEDEERVAHLQAKNREILKDELDAAQGLDVSSWSNRMEQFQADWGRGDNWADEDDDDNLPVPASSSLGAIEPPAGPSGESSLVEDDAATNVAEPAPVAENADHSQPEDSAVESSDPETIAEDGAEEGAKEEAFDHRYIYFEGLQESVSIGALAEENSKLVVSPVRRVRRSSSFSEVEGQIRSVSSSTAQNSSSGDDFPRNSDTEPEELAADDENLESEEAANGKDDTSSHPTTGIPRSPCVTFGELLSPACPSPEILSVSQASISGVLSVRRQIDPLPRSPHRVDTSTLAPASPYGLPDVEEETEDELRAAESASPYICWAEQLQLVESSAAGELRKALIQPSAPEALSEPEWFGGSSRSKDRKAQINRYKALEHVEEESTRTNYSASVYSQEPNHHTSMPERPSAPAPGDVPAIPFIPESPIRRSPTAVESNLPASTITLLSAQDTKSPVFEPADFKHLAPRIQVTFADDTVVQDSRPIKLASPTAPITPAPTIFLKTPAGTDVPISEAALRSSTTLPASEASVALADILSTPLPEPCPFVSAMPTKPDWARKLGSRFSSTPVMIGADEDVALGKGRGLRRHNAKTVAKKTLRGMLARCSHMVPWGLPM